MIFQGFQSISRDNSLSNICVTSALFGQKAFVNTGITLSVLEHRTLASDHLSPSLSLLVWPQPLFSLLPGNFCLLYIIC